MRPGSATAQGEDRVLHRERSVGANTELGSRRRDILRGVIQREGTGARQHLLGIGRQAVGRELSGGVGRDAYPRRDEAIAAFDPSRIGIGVELRVQTVDPGDGDRAIRRHILKAIGKRSRHIGRPVGVAREGTGLEQVRAPEAEAVDAEIGAAARQRKAHQRRRRDPVVRASGKAERARGRRA